MRGAQVVTADIQFGHTVARGKTHMHATKPSPSMLVLFCVQPLAPSNALASPE